MLAIMETLKSLVENSQVKCRHDGFARVFGNECTVKAITLWQTEKELI